MTKVHRGKLPEVTGDVVKIEMGTEHTMLSGSDWRLVIPVDLDVNKVIKDLQEQNYRHFGKPNPTAIMNDKVGEEQMYHTTGSINDLIVLMCEKDKNFNTDEISDRSHNFGQLYRDRMVLFSITCAHHKEKSWKSKLHDDGTMFDNYFIVGINTPEGQFTYHYHNDCWDSFDVEVLEHAPKWDGHTSDDIVRLLSLLP